MRKLSAPLSFLFRPRTSKRQDSSHLQVVLGEDNLSRTPVNFLGNWMPAELVGLIFDHCDSNTLRTSSLVCKYWRASTIHHLFSWAAVSPATTPAFFDFLETKSEEHVGWFVRSLSLTTGSDCGDEISTAAVRRLSSHLQLSSLKLSIYENDMDPAQRKDLCVFHSTFETITTLELALYSNMFIEAAEVISSFPVLETLIISGTLLLQDKEEKSVTKQFSEGGTGMYRVEQELPINHTVPSTVHTVHFPTLYNSSIFLHWLQSHKHKPLISTLVLGGGAFPPSVASMTSNYLRELGDTLQCLTMTEWWLGPIRRKYPVFLPRHAYGLINNYNRLSSRISTRFKLQYKPSYPRYTQRQPIKRSCLSCSVTGRLALCGRGGI